MNAIYVIGAAVVLFSSATYAQPTKKTGETPFSQGLELPPGKYAPGVNAPAAIDLPFDLWGSFTYWNVRQDVMNIGYNFPQLVTVPADVVTSTVVSIEDNWEPGFKVGAAYNTPYDGWVSSLEYTWVRSSTSARATAKAGNIGAGFQGTGLLFNDVFDPNAHKVSSKWSMGLDLVDLLVSRPFYEGTSIVTTPFTGLRTLFIRQYQSVNMFVDTVGGYSAVSKTNCWSIGPVLGIWGQWFLGGGFRFEGMSSASLLYTQYTDLSLKLTTPGNLPAVSQRNDLSEIHPMGEVSLGLGWGSYIFDRDYFIDFSADYEFKYFWDQNSFRQFAGILVGSGDDALGALMIHGVTFRAKYDF
jgi:hypothetical protein